MTPRIIPLNPAREYFFDEGCFINELSNSADDAAVSIAQARDQVQAVQPGDVVIIPPLCRQRIANTGGSDLVFLAICSPRFRPGCYEDLEPG